MNNLTKDELNFIIYENALRKNVAGTDLVVIQVVDKQLDYFDFGKEYANWIITVYNTEDKKYYKTTLMEGEYTKNTDVKWKEVFPKEKTIIVYE